MLAAGAGHFFGTLRNDYTIRVQQAAGIEWLKRSLFRKTGDQDPGNCDQCFRPDIGHPVCPEEDTSAAFSHLFPSLVLSLDHHPAVAPIEHLQTISYISGYFHIDYRRQGAVVANEQRAAAMAVG